VEDKVDLISELRNQIKDLKEQIEFLKSLIKVGEPVPGQYDIRLAKPSDNLLAPEKPQTPIALNKSWSNIRTRLQEAERGDRGTVDEAIKESISSSLGRTSIT